MSIEVEDEDDARNALGHDYYIVVFFVKGITGTLSSRDRECSLLLAHGTDEGGTHTYGSCRLTGSLPPSDMHPRKAASTSLDGALLVT